MERTELLDFITNAMQACPSDNGWILLSTLGNALRTADAAFAPQAYGAEKLAPLLRSFSDAFEVHMDTERYPPVAYVRLTNATLSADRRIRASTATSAAPALDNLKAAPRPSHIPLLGWSYLPDIAGAVSALRDVALKERWSFGDHIDPNYPYPILWNYLRYTFFRLRAEGKVAETSGIAAFNTGLVDSLYEPIYAVFRTNPNTGRQRWRWSSFCTAGDGRDGKDIVRAFGRLPQQAHYFSNIEDMIYDVRCGAPSVDWLHVIVENIERLPTTFLEDNAPRGFAFRNPATMSSAERAAFYAALGAAVKEDGKTYRSMKNRLADALDLAIKRTRWNFKTAIPQYYPRKNAMSLLLPLALVSEDAVDIALVVEKTPSGSYLGHTIFPLDWAYMNARLVCRPDSDWLVPERISSNDSVEPDLANSDNGIEQAP